MFLSFPALALAALALLGLLLLHTSLTDLRARRIANGACLLAALAALPFWIGMTGGHPAASLAQAMAIAAVAALLLLALWALGLLGGGDAKLLAALMLWMSGDTLAVLVVVTSLSGGGFALAAALRRRLARRSGADGIPYGPAIALGAIAALAPQAASLFEQLR